MSRKLIETFSDSTSRSLTSSQSGSLIFIDTTSAEVTVNLPPPEAGLHYEFLISHTATNANDFLLKSVNSSYTHTALMYLGRLSASVGKTLTISSSAQTNLGDRVLLDCNGSNWFVSLKTEDIVNYTFTA